MSNPDSSLDLKWMREAIALSREATQAGDGPYGAVLVSATGERLHGARNTAHSTHDFTAHAEMVVVREATARLGAGALDGSTVYASGEPCAMCAGAMFWAGTRRIVFAAPNRVQGEILGGSLLPIECSVTLAHATPSVQVEGPLLEDEAVAVLRDAASR